VLKFKSVIIDIISRVKTLEGGSDDVREVRQTVHAAVQIPSGHGSLERPESRRPDRSLLWRSSDHDRALEEGFNRKRAGDLLPADDDPGVRETDRRTGTVDRS